ncbi:hypothetical protein C8Q72DRAFT_776083 [Fomitopsis betulina]|nr:hypothetical protein C8Q72DRAFT_776083 [Fomitopsis betulina]
MFSFRVLLSAAAAVLAVSSIPVTRDVDDSLVPEFGVQAGVPDPAGSASCVNSATGVLIPCQCPMSRDSFIAELNKNVAAGKVLNNPSVAVTFPEDSSVASQLARLQACSVTLQNFNGTGVGCPIAATNWVSLRSNITSGGVSSVSSSTATSSLAASSSASESSTATRSSSAGSTSPPTATSSSNGTAEASLVPAFGITAGQNATGTGDCDGNNGVKIPCFCPPDRDGFIGNLTANIAAGHVLTNPSVLVSFPLDSSVQSQLTRLGAALVTLQNQRGTGVGCPAAATTWGALQKSLQAQL